MSQENAGAAADDRHGGCQCGAVRFRTHGAPRFVSNCHCASCRKATGAAFSTWVGFKDANTEWTAPAASFYASSPNVQRGFCAACGTPLSYAGSKWPGEIHFLAGVFDDAAAFTPAHEIFTEDALPWMRNHLGKEHSHQRRAAQVSAPPQHATAAPSSAQTQEQNAPTRKART